MAGEVKAAQAGGNGTHHTNNPAQRGLNAHHQSSVHFLHFMKYKKGPTRGVALPAVKMGLPISVIGSMPSS